MNYLAHAFRFLDAPHKVAGACLPDWLRAVNRRARLHDAALTAVVAHDAIDAELLVGARAHHGDDAIFHAHPTFDGLTHAAVTLTRALSRDARFRASTIGHVLIEMLLDAALLRRAPGCGERYYEALSRVDVERVRRFAQQHTGHALPTMGVLFERFCRARFVLRYQTDEGVREAMQGVLWQLGLPPLPAGFVDVVAALRPKVDAAVPALSQALSLGVA